MSSSSSSSSLKSTTSDLLKSHFVPGDDKSLARTEELMKKDFEKVGLTDDELLSSARAVNLDIVGEEDPVFLATVMAAKRSQEVAEEKKRKFAEENK